MMEFVKEFAVFLHKNDILKFGDFTLANGKNSPYYIDLRLVPSYPVEFRMMIKAMQNLVSDRVGLDAFDTWASVPTGGLIIASALAIETVKPVIYVRNKAKDHGTAGRIEGRIIEGARAIMVDDVATTGMSVVHGIRALKDVNLRVEDACVIVNRMEGAAKELESEGVRMHSLTDIVQIAEILVGEELVSPEILGKIRERIDSG